MKKSKIQENQYSTVSLPTPLVNEIKKNIEGTGIHSVSQYVTFILRQILSSPERHEIMDKKEEEEVKSRLKNLGYLK